MNPGTINPDVPFFLGPNDHRIYAVEFCPAPENQKGVGVLLCKPIWGERIRTHRIFTHLGRELCGMGFHAITCDYYGDGNSGGESAELTFDGMIADVASLHEHLSGTYGLSRFVAMGLRLGASCAISVSARTGMEKILAVEPVLNPMDYLMKSLRANLSGQMVRHKKVIRNREQLVQDIQAGGEVNVDGFLVGKTMWDSFAAASPLKADTRFQGELSLIGLTEKPGALKKYEAFAEGFPKGRVEGIPKEFVWTDWKVYSFRPPLFFEKIRTELEAVAGKDVGDE